MIEKNKVKEYFKKNIKRDFDYSDVFVEESRNLIISCEDNKIEKIISGKDNGIGIRTILKDKTEYSYSNDIAEFIKNSDYSADLVEKKVEIVNIANKAAKLHDSRIKQVTIAYSEKIQNIVIVNSFDVTAEETRKYMVFFINVIAEGNNIIQTGFETVGVSGEIKLEIIDPEELATQAAKRAVLMLSAKQSPASSMPVVLDKEAGGVMIHEAIGHSLESDLVQRNMSKFTGKINQKIASPIVSVVDDPTIPAKFGSYNFDDEGTKSQRTVLVDKGVLVNYLCDINGSLKDNRKSTGNGRRESYQHKAIPRMSNTFILPGSSTTSEIIKQVKKGLYVKKMGGGQVNPVTSDFVFDVKEGYIIENGEVTYPVRGAILTGNGLEVLKKIEMVGNEIDFIPGRCGKDGQLVPVTDAEPTLLISDIIVGGTNI